jgi:hypothetical protein
VDAGVLLDVLAQVVDADVHQHRAVERAAAVVGVARAVGGDAVEVHLERVHREAAAVGPDAVDVGGVPGDRGVEVVEGAGAGHVGLAGQRLLGRAAVVAHGAGDAVRAHGRLHGEGRAERADAVEVVAAAVAGAAGDELAALGRRVLREARQRVVLAEDADDRCALAPGGDEGRVHPADAPGDGEAVRRQLVGDQLRGEPLLEADLGALPDRARVRGEALVVGVEVVDHRAVGAHGA